MSKNNTKHEIVFEPINIDNIKSGDVIYMTKISSHNMDNYLYKSISDLEISNIKSNIATDGDFVRFQFLIALVK